MRNGNFFTFSSIISCLSNVINRVSKTEQQMWQHVDNVRLEQPSKHVAQHLECEKSSLAMVRILLVGHGIGQLLHNVHLFQR